MIKHLTNRFDNFIEQRLLVANSVVTHHKRTYILPNRFGYLLLIIILLMLIAATNYQNSLAFVLTFMLIAIGHNTLVITYRNLLNLQTTILPTKPIYLGQSLHIPVKVQSLNSRDHFSVGIGHHKKIQQLLNLPSGKVVQTEIEYQPTKRGWFKPERFYLATTYPLGVFRVWSWFRCQHQYLVYPKPEKPPFDVQQLGYLSDLDSQDIKAGHEDFYSIREYQAGDARRDIHWRAYAKGQGLATKQFSEPKGQLATLDYRMFDSVEPYNRVELRLSWLCYLIREAAGSQTPFGLSLPGQNFPPAQGKEHVEHCLQALAEFGQQKQQANNTAPELSPNPEGIAK